MYRKIKSIQFHKDILIITTHNEKPYVAIKPICEAAGLTWGSQYNRIMRDEVLSEAVFITKTPSEGGEQDTLFLPVMMLQGWMFGVSIKRVKPELRPKLLQYKRECYQVLHDHFNNSKAPPISSSSTRYPCRILHTFNEYGVIVGARIAEPDEDLTSPKNFAETLKKRGYALVRIEEFAGIIA